MPWHHVIPRHEWKARFGNVRGLNAQDNLVNLTTEQHAQVHRLLLELNGSQYDNIAALSISKLIGAEEAQKRAASFANKGKKRALGVKRTVEQNAARSEFMRGNKNCVGRKSSDRQKAAASKASLGRKKSPESIAKYIESRRRNKFAVVSQIVDCRSCKAD